MWNYVIRRLLYAFPTLLGVLFLTFVIFFALNPPKKRAAQIIGGKGATELQIMQWLADNDFAELSESGHKKIDRRKQLTDEAATNGKTPIDVLKQLQSENIAIRSATGTSKDEIAAKTKAEGKSQLELLVAWHNAGLIDLTLAAAEKDTARKEAQKKKEEAEKAAKGEQPEKEGADKKDDAAAAEPAAKPADFTDPFAGTEIAWGEADFIAESTSDWEVLLASDYAEYNWGRLLWNYVTDLLTFNFGETNEKRPVTEVLGSGFWPSLKLMIPAFLIAEFFSLFFAMFAALYRGTKIDRTLVIASVLLMSISPVAMIMFLQKFFASDWQYFPISGYAEGFAAYQYLILPIFIYVVVSLGDRVRFNRILILDEVGQDYVRTARAKGVGQNTILFKHVLRNVLIPLITRWAVIIPNLYLGSLLLESFFGVPGLGDLTLKGVLNLDLNLVKTLVFIGTIIYILATLLADVLYAIVDPRVKLS